MSGFFSFPRFAAKMRGAWAWRLKRPTRWLARACGLGAGICLLGAPMAALSQGLGETGPMAGATQMAAPPPSAASRESAAILIAPPGTVLGVGDVAGRAPLAEEISAVTTVLEPILAARTTKAMRVRRGDTVERVLIRAGAPRAEAGLAIAAMAERYDARGLRAGQTITVFLEENADHTRLIGLAIEPDATSIVQVSRTSGDTFIARTLEVPVTKRLAVARGSIKTSLYVDALDAGASPQVVADIANLLAFSVDFQRQIYPDDPFEILFEEFVTPDGTQVATGEFLYVRFAPQQRRNLEYWRFQTHDGQTGYYGADGESAKRFLMKTPINGARLSSNFGPRRHPVLGYTRMHKGTDFAAPVGTPIYAAGDGVIERASPYGSFGNYLRIRHANGYKTVYAHLSRFASNMRQGRRVTQGQVVGYVGATGRVTGPHLHYEVIKNGLHINPMSMRAPTGRKLTGDELNEFMVAREIIDQLRFNASGAAAVDDQRTQPGPVELAGRVGPGPDDRS